VETIDGFNVALNTVGLQAWKRSLTGGVIGSNAERETGRAIKRKASREVNMKISSTLKLLRSFSSPGCVIHNDVFEQPMMARQVSRAEGELRMTLLEDL